MIKKVYFVRHGQTDWNRDKKIMGHADIPLNDSGREQARETRNILGSVHFSAILTSPLVRARETADIIAELHQGTPVIITDELIERDFGEYEGAINDGNYFGLWDYHNDTIENGETQKELFDRVVAFLDKTKDQYEGTILLVAHGGIGLMIEAYHRGIPEDGNMLQYVSNNAEIKMYELGD